MSNENVDYREKALEIIRGKTSYVYEGGGALAASIISGLERLRELGGLTEITDVTGSSIGSIIATALACRAEIDYMKDVLYNLDFKKFQDNDCFLRDIVQLIKNYGVNKTDPIRNFVGGVLHDLVDDPEITFLQLFEKTGIKLTITYLSMKYRTTIYANYLTEPNSLVRETAVKSSTIPLFYEAYFEKDGRKKTDIQFDGGTTANYPINYPRSQGIDPVKIIGFKFVSSDEDPITGELEVAEELPSNVIKVFTYLVEVIRQQALKVHVHKEDWKLTVKIPVGKLKSTDFDMSEAEKEWLFNQGRIAVDRYVDELTKLLEKGEFPY